MRDIHRKSLSPIHIREAEENFQLISDVLGFDKDDLISYRRSPELLSARYFGMYLLCTDKSWSHADIAFVYGDKCRTVASKAVKIIGDRLTADAAARRVLSDLRAASGRRAAA